MVTPIQDLFADTGSLVGRRESDGLCWTSFMVPGKAKHALLVPVCTDGQVPCLVQACSSSGTRLKVILRRFSPNSRVVPELAHLELTATRPHQK